MSNSQTVFAGLRGVLSQRTRQELYMVRLVLGDLHEPSADEIGETGCFEVGVCECCEALCVESVFEVFESEGEI